MKSILLGWNLYRLLPGSTPTPKALTAESSLVWRRKEYYQWMSIFLSINYLAVESQLWQAGALQYRLDISAWLHIRGRLPRGSRLGATAPLLLVIAMVAPMTMMVAAMTMPVSKCGHGAVEDEEGDDHHRCCEPLPYHRVVTVPKKVFT